MRLPICTDGKTQYGCSSSGWTTWGTIKTYAEDIISIIRNYSDNLILVGTPIYSSNPGAAAGNYLSDSNVGYVFHFYAETHELSGTNWPAEGRPTYQQGITTVLNAGKPVFVTEYGTTNADGGDPNANNYNTHDTQSSNAWHTFMDNNKISSCAWSVNDKYEGSSFFGTSRTNKLDLNTWNSWDNTSYMTASGQYIFNKLRAYANSAPWRSGSGVVPSSSSAGSAGIASSSSGGGGSSSVCKDSQGRDYYCEWGTYSHSSANPGCFPIDTDYDGRTCEVMIAECRQWGYLYVNVSINGVYCNGTEVE
ncbi:endoglucanase [Fibrobacteria bacterium R8-3-H12]